MKKLFILLVFLSGLLLIGCQENSITDPVQSSVDKASSTEPTVEGSLGLQGRLSSPYATFDLHFVIDGDVNYQLSYKYLDNSDPYRQRVSILKLQIKAQLSNYSEGQLPPVNQKTVGVISESTTDVVNIDTDAPYTITKKFMVQKSEYSISLLVRFDVSAKGAKINSMWIEPTRSDSKVTDDSSY